MQRVLFVTTLLASLCPAFGAQPTTAPATTYQIDTQSSRIFVKVGSATLIGHEHGVEARLKSGTLDFSGTGQLVFDLPSFTADTPEARKRVGLKEEKSSDAPKVTQTMRGPEVLNVTSFPTATFKVKSVTPLNGQAAAAPGNYAFDGDLSLHGVDRKIRFGAKLVPAQQHLQLTGSFTIKQSDFGMKPYSTLGGMAKVADPLEITGDLILVPAQNQNP